MNHELRKHLKRFNRLENHNSVVCQKFYSDNDSHFIRQFVNSAHLRQEVLYRVQYTKYAGPHGISKTVALSPKHLYLPSFVEILTNLRKNCSSCIQTKPAKHATLRSSALTVNRQTFVT